MRGQASKRLSRDVHGARASRLTTTADRRTVRALARAARGAGRDHATLQPSATPVIGALAEAYYGGTPAVIEREALGRLDAALRSETLGFARAFGVPVAADA